MMIFVPSACGIKEGERACDFEGQLFSKRASLLTFPCCLNNCAMRAIARQQNMKNGQNAAAAPSRCRSPCAARAVQFNTRSHVHRPESNLPPRPWLGYLRFAPASR